MTERHISSAIALATSLFNLREQLVAALRAAAAERMDASEAGDHYARYAVIQNRSLELHADDALYAIGRDGISGLEFNVRHAVDEIVREALDEARRNWQRRPEAAMNRSSR